MTLHKEIAALKAPFAELLAENAELAAQNAELRARLAKVSHNSGKPLSTDGRGNGGRLAQSPARNLLERLLLGQDQVLAFLDDLAIPFDNHQAERDLRGLKIHQKISGCFRSDTGGAAFARLQSYLSTLRKQGHRLLAALETAVAGQPFYPAFA